MHQIFWFNLILSSTKQFEHIIFNLLQGHRFKPHTNLHIHHKITAAAMMENGSENAP